jgi:hypothetical protein
MRPTKTGLVGLAALLLTAVSGCGPITPGGLMMKAGTWVVKEAVMKEIKNERKDGKAKKAQQEREHQGPTTRHED